MSERIRLRCDSVTKAFGAGRGVFDVALSVRPGEGYALLGPNGSGKTTLINLCLGYLTPDSGRIEVDGIDVQGDSVRAKMRVAYVPEVARLYPHLSARGHLTFFDRLMGRAPRPDEYESLLATLRLPDSAAGEPVRNYSKGMRQKVSIALGLLKGADVFLLDEPTSGLDPNSTREFAGILARLKSEGRAILVSTHDVGNLSLLADRVGMLAEGRLVSEGDPATATRQLWSGQSHA